jgi:large subunit ribosomal protein L4
VQLPVYNIAGEVVRQIDVSDAVFGAPMNEAVVHQVLVGQRANQRQGTASTKTRSYVNGSTKKLFRQKGTGYARAGSKKSPLRRGGAVTFGPHPRDYRQEIPRKMRRMAIRCILSAKAGGGELKVLEAFNFEEPKTKEMLGILAALGVANTALIVTGEPEENVIKSARNVGWVKTMPAGTMSLLDMMSYKSLLMTEDAVRAAEKLWGNGSSEGKE